MDISDTPETAIIPCRPAGDFTRILLSAACDEIVMANELYGRAEEIRNQLTETEAPDSAARLQADAYGIVREAAGREMQIAQRLWAAFSPEEPPDRQTGRT